YALTLLAATAYGIFYHAIELAAEEIDQEKYDKMELFVDEALQFLYRICNELKNSGASRRDDAVIDAVFVQLRSQHEVRRSLPMHIDKNEDAYVRSKIKIIKLFEVQNRILWHLSVIDVPVEADVLACCPLVRETIAEAWEGDKPEYKAVVVF